VSIGSDEPLSKPALLEILAAYPLSLTTAKKCEIPFHNFTVNRRGSHFNHLAHSRTEIWAVFGVGEQFPYLYCLRPSFGGPFSGIVMLFPLFPEILQPEVGIESKLGSRPLVIWGFDAFPS